jgi:hypothetical protein
MEKITQKERGRGKDKCKMGFEGSSRGKEGKAFKVQRQRVRRGEN